MTQALKLQLDQVRRALIALHKTLVDAERVTYERTMGPIGSPNQFLELLSHDPWFGWLHALSELIVSMDEALTEEEPLTEAVVETLVKRARTLTTASEEGEGFARQYFDALQRDTDVVVAHANVVKLVRPPAKP